MRALIGHSAFRVLFTHLVTTDQMQLILSSETMADSLSQYYDKVKEI